MQPEDVDARRSPPPGILGRGGATFPVGRKWGVDQPQRRASRTTCAPTPTKASPGTFKDRWILEHAPHLLVEVDADRRLRAAGAPCVRLHPRRVRPAAAPASRGAGGGRTPPGWLGEGIARQRLRAATSSSTAAPARTCAARRRACSPRSRGSKGYPRNRPPRLTVRGLYQRADRRQQRRDARQRHRHRRATAPRPSAASARRRARARS